MLIILSGTILHKYLLITGDNELTTGLPTTPYTDVSELICLKQNSSSIRAVEIWPGAKPFPEYVQHDPKRNAKILVGRPEGPIPTTTAGASVAISRNGNVSLSFFVATAIFIIPAPLDRIFRTR